VKRGVGGGRELRQVRTALRPPPGRVPGAQPPLPARAHTPAHPALRRTEHRIARVEGQHLGAKRWPDRGHQLLQQPGQAAHRQSTSVATVVAGGNAGSGRVWPSPGLPTAPPATGCRRQRPTGVVGPAARRQAYRVAAAAAPTAPRKISAEPIAGAGRDLLARPASGAEEGHVGRGL